MYPLTIEAHNLLYKAWQLIQLLQYGVLQPKIILVYSMAFRDVNENIIFSRNYIFNDQKKFCFLEIAAVVAKVLGDHLQQWSPIY